MNHDILNDDKVIEELRQKLEQYNIKIKGYEEKKNELQLTLSDLNKKTAIDGISDTTKEKIEEVMSKVKDKITEIDSQIRELNGKIDEINDTLNTANDLVTEPEPLNLTLEPENEIFGEPEYSEIPELTAPPKTLEFPAEPKMPEPPVLSSEDENKDINEVKENKENPETLNQESETGKLENKIKELENKKTQKENEQKELEAQRSDIETNKNNDEFIAQIDSQMKIIETQKQRLEETAGSIDSKIGDGSLNSATRERLVEMRGEVQEKIDELQGKINELQDKKDEYWDRIIDKINEKIDGKGDEIDALNDEIEKIYDEIDVINGKVDENVINEVKKSAGFDNIGSLLDNITNSVNSALKSVNKSINISIPEIKIPNIKIPEINIPKLNIRIPEQNYSYNGGGNSGSSPDSSSASASSASPVNNNINNSGEKYDVNFCSSKMGAKIFSVCCQHNDDCRAEHILNDDPNLVRNWYATDNHGEAKIVRPHWVIIDFGEVKTFNYLKLVKCSPGIGDSIDTGNTNWDASAWRFEISSDKEHWVEFNSETNDKSAIYEKSFGELTGRYVRLYIDAGGSDPNNKYESVRLYDLRLEMRDKNGNSINLCKGAKIESCCVDWSNPATHLIDDDPNYNTIWYAGGAHEEKITQPHWVIIDMGQARTFNNIRLVKASAGKNDFGHMERDMSAWRAEVSGDRVNWKEFNKETNDQSAIYEKTFDTQTGRYIRLWVDAAGCDPNNKNAPVILYDVRIEMADRKEKSDEVTFEDIASIAPFAKKETLDKLVDKLIATEDFDFNRIKSLAPFLSKETLSKLVLKCSSKADINTIKALAPFLDKSTLDGLVDSLNEDMDFEKIKSLAPFLSRETLEKCVTRNGTKLDMKRLRSLAPFLGSDYIDEIISKML